MHFSLNMQFSSDKNFYTTFVTHYKLIHCNITTDVEAKAEVEQVNCFIS